MVKKVSDDGFSARAFWTQGAEGGLLDKPEWIRVMEPKTKLQSSYGPIGISEQAHIDALELWKQGTFARVDHNKNDPSKEFAIEIEDAKWVPGDGLYLSVKGDRKEVKMLKEGKAKPSIEVSIPSKEDYDGEWRRAKKYIPTGLGIMIEGEAMGENVGAFAPDMINAIGGIPNNEGDNMGNEEENETFDQEKVDGFFTDFEKNIKENKEDVIGKIEDYRTNLDKLYGEKNVPLDVMEKFVDIYKSAKTSEETPPDDNSEDKTKELLKKLKGIEAEKKKKDELAEEFKGRISEVESLLIERMMNDAKKDGVHVELIDIEGKSYEQVSKEIEIEKKRAEVYGKKIPSDGNPNPASSPPKKRGLFDERGYIDDKSYEEAKKESPFFNSKKQSNKLSEIFGRK